MNDIVILVGGKGSRLGKLTKKNPKPLIKIKNKRFLDIILSKLIRYNFKNIYLLCSFKKKKFFSIYNNKKIHNSKIICIDEGNPKDTGGALFKLRKRIKNSFFCINGDTFFDIDYNLLKIKKDEKQICNIAITNNNNYKKNSKVNNLSLTKKGLIQFSNKKTKLMNGGVYFFKKKIFKYIPNKKISLENDIFKILIYKKKIKGIFFKDKFIDIGSKNNLSYLKKNPYLVKQKAAFLDRDGVINRLIKSGYVENYKQLKLLKGVVDGIKFLNQNGYLTILVTNQSCVGRSIISEKKLNRIHLLLQKYLKKRNNSYFDDIFYSPYYKYSKSKKYRLNSFDRKPNPGMLIKAILKWNIDLKSSFFIGDSKTDFMAAKKVGVKFYYKDKVSLLNQFKKILNR